MAFRYTTVMRAHISWPLAVLGYLVEGRTFEVIKNIKARYYNSTPCHPVATVHGQICFNCLRTPCLIILQCSAMFQLSNAILRAGLIQKLLSVVKSRTITILLLPKNICSYLPLKLGIASSTCLSNGTDKLKHPNPETSSTLQIQPNTSNLLLHPQT